MKNLAELAFVSQAIVKCTVLPKVAHYLADARTGFVATELAIGKDAAVSNRQLGPNVAPVVIVKVDAGTEAATFTAREMTDD